ncbi:MAG: hypothetical protein AABW50_05130 [Nanoarchaeota archaeon]
MADESKLEILSIYAEINMSHNSAGEFLSNMGKEVKDFNHSNLTAVYEDSDADRYKTKDIVRATELKLAEIAFDNSFLCVTNLDYCQYSSEKRQLILKGTGLRKMNLRKR